MSSDPASWLVVESGMPVHASDGEEVGSVTDVVGDEDKDIFNGLMVRTSRLSGSRYVPAERVARILTDRVELDLTAQELDALDERGPQDL